MRIGDLGPPEGELPDPDATRAPAGGTVGVNGYRYEGGQFLPSTEAPPGKWRVEVKGRSRLVDASVDLIEPGVRAAQPTPYARGILQLIMHFTDTDARGRMRVKPSLSPEALERFGTLRPGCRGVVGKRTYTLAGLVRRYNRGERWIDASPA